ncbi:MAG: hypothetical protein HOW73_20490 [Polyangiaceae bacterium]|nr:hypothetical protein [Polyangiaceae bacterium]
MKDERLLEQTLYAWMRRFQALAHLGKDAPELILARDEVHVAGEALRERERRDGRRAA